ncbi:outer membrane protein assembly factor BamE domain-containing protein [Thauera sp. WH-2]|uniref:outer membrane protein assembly factor BamE domain-containing protein n=1 Tax=unclassified Thauera TaxID=2609274 RepID=UPI002A3F295C|nr:outer membrane protein assembly factor BamE [Thauera sp.]
MKRFIAWLCGLLSAIGITACDYINMRELQPGVSTAAEVRERFGPPHMEWRNEDGSLTWEFSRQPEGIECFMITIGSDQILRSIDQVLNEQTFARVEKGMDPDQVRRLLGKPASSQFFAVKQETVWDWKYSHGFAGTNEPEYFTVSFNVDGRVTGTGRYTLHRGR